MWLTFFFFIAFNSIRIEFQEINQMKMGSHSGSLRMSWYQPVSYIEMYFVKQIICLQSHRFCGPVVWYSYFLITSFMFFSCPENDFTTVSSAVLWKYIERTSVMIQPQSKMRIVWIMCASKKGQYCVTTALVTTVLNIM